MTEGARIGRSVFVSGRVQGVGFRYSTRDQAVRLGVAGWVRNLPDGRVEAFVEGEPKAVTAMLDWLRSGPPGASVDDVRSSDVEADDATDFRIR